MFRILIIFIFLLVFRTFVVMLYLFFVYCLLLLNYYYYYYFYLFLLFLIGLKAQILAQLGLGMQPKPWQAKQQAQLPGQRRAQAYCSLPQRFGLRLGVLARFICWPRFPFSRVACTWLGPLLFSAWAPGPKPASYSSPALPHEDAQGYIVLLACPANMAPGAPTCCFLLSRM